MSGFTDGMIDDGFTDPQEYMDYLENKAIDDMEDQYQEEDCWDNDDYDDGSDDSEI